MADEPRITGPTLKVLGALLSSPQDELSGAQVGRDTERDAGAEEMTGKGLDLGRRSGNAQAGAAGATDRASAWNHCLTLRGAHREIRERDR